MRANKGIHQVCRLQDQYTINYISKLEKIKDQYTKPVAVLYSSNEQSEKKIKKTISLIMAKKSKKE